MTASAMAVILAAESTRMKSLPKVLHPVCGRPMIDYVLDSARQGVGNLVVIIGHQSELVQMGKGHGTATCTRAANGTTRTATRS
ncbi:MAG: NTP transferase domain-containing protein [Planctomycetaceae bacterium]